MGGSYGSRWTERETMLAYRLYCELPFGQLDHRNAKVIALASAIGRTPNSVALKLGNLASLDPALKARGIRGMPNASQLDRDVASRFSSNWDEAVLLTSKEWDTVFREDDAAGGSFSAPDGPSETLATTRVRLTQRFFRRAVITAYEVRCAMCRLPNESLLVASHIVPWSVAEEHRTNPSNGLCLCALHDRAFDRGLVSVSPGLEVLVSSRLLSAQPVPVERAAFVDLAGSKVATPTRFAASPEFLGFHRQKVFLA